MRSGPCRTASVLAMREREEKEKQPRDIGKRKKMAVMRYDARMPNLDEEMVMILHGRLKSYAQQ